VSRYLYGASVQGIQDFIFKTNQLQEIVGASEIVKSLEAEFEKISGYQKGDQNILLNAAGNIKAIFDNKKKLEDVVKEFPKKIMQKAYGITISQAVVKMEGKFNEQKEAIKELEKKLKTQRNIPSIPLDLIINIMELAPKTARPLFEIDENKNELDISSFLKRKANKKFYENNPRNREFSNISDFSNSKNKIAVIHADGNGLGQIVPKLGDKLSSFSTKLNEATKKAFNDARNETMDIREVISGGDDLTVICGANYALEFTKNFLDNFEKETSQIQELKDIGFKKLTACAGIAYCNEKYPFHYAVSLAEALCSATKKHAKAINKDLAPSSLMFHKIQSSNFQSWDKFVEDELTITNDQEEIRCDFGPYYLSQNEQPLIEDFENTVKAYRQEGSPISRLREWMGELSKSKQYSENLLDRINEMIKTNNKWKCEIMDNNLKKINPKLCNQELVIDKDGYRKTPIYDILQILSVTEAN
jgi:CRISPR/Cas system-associated protein Cas10 (large subunit of type III CRISPR-Cas system)